MFGRPSSAPSSADDFSAEALQFLQPLFATAMRLTRNRADAEDLVQDTMVRALRFRDRFEPGTNLRAWLYTIAQRKATDAIRSRIRHRAGDIEAVAEGRLAGEPHPVPDDGLWRSVRELPAKQRAAVVHRYVFDLAYREVGERMGISEEAARQNVNAGLRRLRMEVDR